MSRLNGRQKIQMKTGAVALATLVMALAAGAAPAVAQTATVYGGLANFDVVNNTGYYAHGFEIELAGIQASQIYYTFATQRYGAPEIVPIPIGVIVRWQSPYDAEAQRHVQATAPHLSGTPFAGTCYQWHPETYDAAGCEHFGVSLVGYANPLRAIYRWLGQSPEQPETLIPIGSPLAVANPLYSVQPGRPANPPLLAMDIDAPEPADSPQRYGDAQWMKVFVTQLPRSVTLDELVLDNPIVPQDPTHLETDWALLQTEPATGGPGTRGQHRNQGNLDVTTRAVVRRIELYQYTGAYDPVTHEALCADLSCAAPSAGEVGEFLSAQMTAANVQADALVVTKAGNGTVESSDHFIGCGSKCSSFYNGGTTVTLAAAPASNSAFAGWSGACAGASPTCTLVVSGEVDVRASFVVLPSASGGGGSGGGGGGGSAAAGKLSVATSGGKGLIASAGGAINCGNTCQASLAAGTTVALTVAPEAGFTFVNWSGACSGTAPVCTVTVGANTVVQANLKK